MNNWHLIQKFIPLRKNSENNFENTITSKIKNFYYYDSLNIQPTSRLKFYSNLVWYYFFLQKQVNKSKNNMLDSVDTFQHVLVNSLSYDDCIDLIRKYQKIFLRPEIGINSFFLSTFYNFLYRKYDNGKLRDLVILESVNTKQVSALSKLVSSLRSMPILWKHIENNDKKIFLKNSEGIVI